MFAMFASAIGLIVYGAPMPTSVSSWEGEFHRTPDDVTVQIEGHDGFRLCFYQLAGASGGIVVGIADSRGERIVDPVPNHRGVQPIYRGYVVTIQSGREAELVLMFDVQGQGGCRRADSYRVQNGKFTMIGRSYYGGRHDPVWKKEKMGEPGGRPNASEPPRGSGTPPQA